MVDVPQTAEGLSWIVEQGLSKLLLIPGLQATSITAAADGDQPALAYLRFAAQHHAAFNGSSNLSPLDKACLDAAAATRHDDLLGFVYRLARTEPDLESEWSACGSFTSQHLQLAVHGGQLAALRWLKALCPSFLFEGNPTLMYTAASCSNLEMLKHLRAGAHPAAWDDDVAVAAAPSWLCISWLLCQDPPCPSHSGVLAEVARYHDTEALNWLRHHASVPPGHWDGTVVAAAAEHGKLPMLQYLRAQDPPVHWDASACRAAAQNGHLHVLDWMRSVDPPCPWDESVTAAAACSLDSLDILQWLRCQNPPCPWGISCTAAAAKRGNLPLLKWLRSQHPPCPFDDTCTTAAASQPDIRIIRWLRAQSPPCAWSDKATRAAAERSDVPMLQWMLSQDLPPTLHPDCPARAFLSGDLDLLQWLHSNGCSPSAEVYYLAAAHSSEQVLRWLRALGPMPAAARPHDSFYLLSDGPIRRLEFRTPRLMFLADLGAPLSAWRRKQLRQARSTYCTFHGLLRWCYQAISDPSKGAHHAFNSTSGDDPGQMLLVRLSQLPSDLINKIAVAADIQHDIFES